jgi:CRP-like cAMP-binding protein
MMQVAHDVHRHEWPDESVLSVPVELPRGARIFRQGQTLWSVFLVTQGVVKITVPRQNSDALVALRTKGSMLAIAPALLGIPQPAVATALTPCELRSLPLERLKALLLTDSRVGRWLTYTLAAEVHEHHLRAEALHSGRSDTSLEWLIVQLFRAAHVLRGDGSLRMGFHLPVGDIGSLIGVSRQWASQLLHGFAHRGLIGWERDWLVLPKESPLLRQVRTEKS